MLFTIESFPKNISEANPANVLELMDQNKAQHITGATRYKPYSTTTEYVAMDDVVRAKKALINASNAGDVEAAYKIANYIEHLTAIETPSEHFINIQFPPWLALYKPSDISDEDFSAYQEGHLKNVSANGLLKLKEVALSNAEKREEFAEDIVAEYEINLQKALQQGRVSTIGTAFLAWAVPIGILYFLGRSVGWVYRGFKKKE